MAKKQSVSQFDRALGTIPSRAKFEITMAANSEDEVWDDIDTNLLDGQAWLVYGGEFIFEVIDPTLPHSPFDGALNDAYCLQAQRNDDSEILLNFCDDDLMFEWRMSRDYALSTSGAINEWHIWPQRFGHRTLTMAQTIRMLFRTASDDTALSVATIQIAGFILYDVINAPSIGASKLGNIANL